MVPLALNALGKESYAVWTLATGLTSLFAFADLGLGNTLMSLVARHQTTETGGATIQRLVSTSYIVLSGVSLGLMILLLLFIGVLPWRGVLGIEDAATSDGAILVIVGLLFAANIPLGLINRVLFGMQMVAQSYYWQAIGPAVSVALAVILPRLWSDPLAFVVAVAAGPVAASLLSSARYYTTRLRAIAPTATRPAFGDVLDMAKNGLVFFFISLSMAIATAMDTLLLPHFIGLGQLADFSVVWRLFAQAGMVLSLMSLPFWPIAADALARGDAVWVKRTLRRMQAANLVVMGAVGAVAVLAGQVLLDLWLGDQITADRTLLLGFTVWWLLQAATYPLFMVQNAALQIRTQLWCWMAFVVLAALIKVTVLSAGADASVMPWISSGLYVALLVPCAWIVSNRVLAVHSHS